MTPAAPNSVPEHEPTHVEELTVHWRLRLRSMRAGAVILPVVVVAVVMLVLTIRQHERPECR